MGAPPDLRAFLDLLRSQGTTGIEVRPGQYLASLSPPAGSLSLRLGFGLTALAGAAAFQRNPDGTATLTYGTGQTTLPVFTEHPNVRTAERSFPQSACIGVDQRLHGDARRWTWVDVFPSAEELNGCGAPTCWGWG